jgi:hypothetical protein
MRGRLIVLLLCAGACRGRPAAAGPSCADPVEPAAGLRIERIAVPSGCVTLVRIDLGRFRLRLVTALADGGARAAPDWARDLHLTGVINSSMYGTDQRSIGMLVAGPTVNRDHDNEKLGAFLAFDPVDGGDAPVVLAGRDCPGFDLAALRRRYRSIVQNYRLLDCDGQPVVWKDARRFSAAAVGLDEDGRAVFIHARTPMQMSELAQLLAARRLRGAMYVEGGPEASLYVKAGATEVADVGTTLLGNSTFVSIPNVLGFAPRED